MWLSYLGEGRATKLSPRGKGRAWARAQQAVAAGAGRASQLTKVSKEVFKEHEEHQWNSNAHL